MATRISFSTHYPARMKELAGKPTRFPEKLIKGLGYGEDREYDILKLFYSLNKECHPEGYINLNPKTTTIRSNYEYWKSKEGQLIQPFFWAGTPYRSKQVVFCPEVRLKRVHEIKVHPIEGIVSVFTGNGNSGYFLSNSDTDDMEYFTQHEGFDHPDHFWMWFDRDFSGAYLELESVEL